MEFENNTPSITIRAGTKNEVQADRMGQEPGAQMTRHYFCGIFLIMGIFLIAHTIVTIILLIVDAEEWNNSCGMSSGKLLVFNIFSSIFWIAMKCHQLYNNLPDCDPPRPSDIHMYDDGKRDGCEGGSADNPKLCRLQAVKGLIITTSFIWSVIVSIGDSLDCYSNVFYKLVMAYAIVLGFVVVCVFSGGVTESLQFNRDQEEKERGDKSRLEGELSSYKHREKKMKIKLAKMTKALEEKKLENMEEEKKKPDDVLVNVKL